MKSLDSAMALVQSVHLDAELALDISLQKEMAKLARVYMSRGLASSISWLETKLAWALNPKIEVACPEYSELRALAFALPSDELPHSKAITAFAYARQIVACLRKTLDLPCRETQEESLVSWRLRNNEIQPLTWEQVYLADLLAEELRVLIPQDVTLADLFPESGPGAVSEKRSQHDRTLNYSINGLGFRGAIHEKAGKSRPIAVPKTWTKMRLIMAEPSSLMLAQKSLQKWLMSQAHSSPMYKYCRFEDQEFQRSKLRREGVASIDLSDASDRVNRLLVWRAFKDRPVLRSFLFQARSQETIDGDRIAMFSTMGNATTFVVMTYLLTAVCRVAESECMHRKARVIRSSVFGDDLVVDQVIYGSVVNLLMKLGFSVNQQKSYCVGDFKEACGLDLYRAEDVTPIKVKSLTAATRQDFDRLLAYCNAFFLRGMWRAARTIQQIMDQKWSVSIGYIGARDVLVSFSCNTILNGKWRKAWQTYIPRLPRDTKAQLDSFDCESTLDYWLANGYRPVDVVPV